LPLSFSLPLFLFETVKIMAKHRTDSLPLYRIENLTPSLVFCSNLLIGKETLRKETSKRNYILNYIMQLEKLFLKRIYIYMLIYRCVDGCKLTFFFLLTRDKDDNDDEFYLFQLRNDNIQRDFELFDDYLGRYSKISKN